MALKPKKVAGGNGKVKKRKVPDPKPKRPKKKELAKRRVAGGNGKQRKSTA